MDQFAQSREDDDLFGDDFEPVSAPTIVEETAPVTSSAPAVVERTHESSRSAPAQDYRKERDANRGRGAARGRGRGRGPPNNPGGLAGSRYAPQPPTHDKPESTPSAPEPAALVSSDTPKESNDATNPPTNETTPPAPATVNRQAQTPDQPQAPLTAERPRPTAVRGDRSLTGGPTHIKLTESELSAKMAAMAILNAKKTERFRRSEADSAAFLQKEEEMKKKRAEEMRNARAMDQERARNRERKLKAQGGREWDSEKVESDIVDGRGRGRSSEFVRGGFGGVIGNARGGGLGGSRFADEEGGGVGEGVKGSRGRGGFEIRGRGNRGGRGGGRGGASAPAVPTPEDFPSLPKAASKAAPPAAVPSKPTEEIVKSPGVEKGHPDWAEEMATPVEEKTMDV